MLHVDQRFLLRLITPGKSLQNLNLQTHFLLNVTKPSNDIEKLLRTNIRPGYILDDGIGTKAVLVR